SWCHLQYLPAHHPRFHQRSGFHSQISSCLLLPQITDTRHRRRPDSYEQKRHRLLHGIPEGGTQLAHPILRPSRGKLFEQELPCSACGGYAMATAQERNLEVAAPVDLEEQR